MDINGFIAMLKDLSANTGLVLEDLADTQLRDLLTFSNHLYYAVSKELADREDERQSDPAARMA